MLKLRILLAGLLIASSAAFAVGVAVERSKGDVHAAGAGATTLPEGSSAREQQEGNQPAQGQPEASHKETLFGINTESNGVVATVVALSLVLAATAVVAPRPALLIVSAAGFGAAAFDGHEIMRQVRESCETVLTLASTAAGLHLMLGAAALIAVAATSETMRGIIAGRGLGLPRG
jgi:hypothetical protein